MNIICVGKYIVQMQYFLDWIDFQFQTYMKYESHPELLILFTHPAPCHEDFSIIVLNIFF